MSLVCWLRDNQNTLLLQGTLCYSPGVVLALHVPGREGWKGAKDTATSLLKKIPGSYNGTLLILFSWPIISHLTTPAAWNRWPLFWVSYAQLKILLHYLLAISYIPRPFKSSV